MAASTRRDPFKGKNEMAGTFRFGRRIALPSTKQVKHDLRMITSAETIKTLEKELEALPGKDDVALTGAPVKPVI
jgi:hypothetical protein